jgi:hypothetical protein
MGEKAEVYLLRIQLGNSINISLRDVGQEETCTFETLEALFGYLKRRLEQHEASKKNS